MSFTRQQAEKLFQHYLNKKLSWFESVDEGLNNLLYFIECENDDQKYVLKICGDAWENIKTESEVNAMISVIKYTNVLISKVVFYSSSKNNEFGVEWIIMARTQGKPLRTSDDDEDDIWSKLSNDQKKISDS